MPANLPFSSRPDNPFGRVALAPGDKLRRLAVYSVNKRMGGGRKGI